jgi:hypothetical protein
MREKCTEAAMANGRSINDEIIYRLLQTLEREGAKKKPSDSFKARGDRSKPKRARTGDRSAQRLAQLED